jgi:hypothetical protein
LSSSLLPKNVKYRIYKYITLPVVLYGCAAWTLTSGEGHRLRVFENRVLRRIFGHKRDEIIGGWPKELHNFYSSNIIKMIKSRMTRWEGHEKYSVLAGKPERGRPPAISRCRWEDNTKWILEKYDRVVWTGFIWLRIGTSGWL